jgi:hypothetical protein
MKITRESKEVTMAEAPPAQTNESRSQTGCPFCGSPRWGVAEPMPHQPYFRITCVECGSAGPNQPSKELAWKSWNKRAPQTSSPDSQPQATVREPISKTATEIYRLFYPKALIEDVTMCDKIETILLRVATKGKEEQAWLIERLDALQKKANTWVDQYSAMACRECLDAVGSELIEILDRIRDHNTGPVSVLPQTPASLSKQEPFWHRTADRPPTKEDGDDCGMVIAWKPIMGVQEIHFRYVRDTPWPFWLPIPPVPKD